jgi:hypothetical protein
MAGRNRKILGHCGARWNSFEIRSFEEGRGLALLALMGLEQGRVSRARFFTLGTSVHFSHFRHFTVTLSC